MKKHKGYDAYKGCIVPKFSDIMINQLAKHDDRGDSWKDADWTWLLMRAKQEMDEVENALMNISDAIKPVELKRVAKECADVANFMMMIADSVGAI